MNMFIHQILPETGKEAKPYQIRDAREFLRRIGVEP